MKLMIWLIPVLIWVSTKSFAVEERQYELEKKINNIEIRHYKEVMAIEVITTGNRRESANRAFRILVQYIKGKNETNLSIPMTAPVSQTQNTEETWAVRFYMPATMKRDEMPAPSDSRINVQALNNNRVAAIRFSGNSYPFNLNKHTELLRTYLTENDYQFVDQPRYAFYNPPFVPWFLRRNEVIFDLKD